MLECFISGRGTLFILDLTASGIEPVSTFDWNDGLFDVTWAENNENLIIAGAGDGAVLLFDVKNSKVWYVMRFSTAFRLTCLLVAAVLNKF